MTTQQGIALAASAVLAAGGVAALLAARVPALSRRARASLPVVGPLSGSTIQVFALVCFGLAYHALAHAFSWGMLKAPMVWALGVAALATAGTLLADALQNRAGDDEPTGGEGGA